MHVREPEHEPSGEQTLEFVPAGADTTGERSGLTNFPTVPGYEIEAELGRGGMGVVYKAHQTYPGRVVALKMILAGPAAGSADLARFKSEAEAIAALGHPNVVQVYEVGEHNGRPYFTLEFCPNGSLADRMRERTPTPREAAETAERIARGVARAHAAGIVHRDLKPANVLIDESGSPKVADFGLAKRIALAEGVTQTGAILGTPTYMAPEQAGGEGKRVGPAADVYALGVILFEMLTGRPPFRGPTPMDTLILAANEEPERPRHLRPAVPRDLEAICLKCLEKDPQRRYATAAEFADDLAHFLSGEPVSAAGSGLLSRVTSSLDRVRPQERFADYGSLMIALAPVMFLPEVWVTVVVWNDWPSYLLPVAQFGRVALFLVLVGYFRGWRWLPHGPVERQVWTLWGGYVLSCFMLGISNRLSHGLLETAFEVKLYQPLACITALAFFTLSASFWGYATLMALGFLAASLLMAIDLNFAPLIFGATWAVALLVIGLRLRRLGDAHA